MVYSHAMSKVSIVIPIYKVEAYLLECLESIRRQTFGDFEVLMVDDGSPDGSADICRSFSERDSRFRLIQQTNGGVTAARRTGVSHATGEYVVFVDGDDSLPADSLEVLLRNMTDDVDMVVAQPDWNPLVQTRRWVRVDEYRKLLINGELYLAMWAKIFRRNLLNDFTFAVPRKIRTGEDWIANLRMSFNTTKPVLLLPDCVYHYRVNQTSVSHTIRRTIEHERCVYEALIASVPSDLIEEYRSSIAAAYALIWVRETKGMVSLSGEAEAFRQLILQHISSKLKTLNTRDSLFLQCPNTFGRCILMMLRWLNGKRCSWMRLISRQNGKVKL